MKPKQDDAFVTASYGAQDANYAQYLADEEKKQVAESWLKEGTVDAWRHERLYRNLDPFLAAFPGAEWLTVGDGRFGKDAHYIDTHGGKAHASDVSDTLLRKGKEKGYIRTFSKQNAEALSFADRAFDFVLCKESYHHLPRPMLGLYEMLRVARRGVVLIEPHEFPELDSLKVIFKRLVKVLMLRAGWGRRLRTRDTAIVHFGGNTFEPVGNYLYPLSRREVEKVALGLNLPCVAFKGMNDFYIKGVEFEPCTEQSALFRKVKREIERRDRACRTGLSRHDYGLLVAAILKQEPTGELRSGLAASGFGVVDLPRNPHAGEA